MVRSLRIAGLVAVLACTAPSWGQVLQPDRFIMVKEGGKSPAKCKVLKTWKEKDGSVHSKVKMVDTGEEMTIVEGPASGVAPAPVSSLPVTAGKPGAASVPTVTHPASVASPAARPGLLKRMFGSPASKNTAPPPASGVQETAPPPIAAPAVQQTRGITDPRRPAGKIELASTRTAPKGSVAPVTARTTLPVAQRSSGDPIERPDIYTGGTSTTTTTSHGTLRTTSATVPVPSPGVIVPPSSADIPVVTSSPVAGCTSCQQKATASECKTCAAGKDRSQSAPCSTCGESKGLRPVVVRDGEPERHGLLSRLFQGEKAIVVKEPKPIIVKEPKPVVVRERAPREVKPKEVVVREPARPLFSPLPKNEGRIGMFSGMRPASPGPVAKSARSRATTQDLPAGMHSVAAANAPALANQTPVGAVIRLPDGSTTVVPISQVGPQIPSVPINASNAFTMTRSPIPLESMDPANAANAFAMATPTRPVPADMGPAPQMPNAFAYHGMGAMPSYPTAMAGAPGMGYTMPNAYYPPPAMGYHPAQQVAYYPAPAMAYPVPAMQAGYAPSADQYAATQCLVTLRQAVLPSERERAAEVLARANWKADPQLVPALVLAAQTDPAPMVRVACLRSLGQMKANTVPTVEAVKALKDDKDARVRQEAAQVLPVLSRH